MHRLNHHYNHNDNHIDKGKCHVDTKVKVDVFQISMCVYQCVKWNSISYVSSARHFLILIESDTTWSVAFEDFAFFARLLFCWYFCFPNFNKATLLNRREKRSIEQIELVFFGVTSLLSTGLQAGLTCNAKTSTFTIQPEVVNAFKGKVNSMKWSTTSPSYFGCLIN